MIEEKVKRLIISGCYGDVLLYKDYFNNEEEISIDNQWSYIVEMLIITIKSIVPSLSEVRNEIDYNRFYEEIKLWKYYRHGGNTLLTNIEDVDSSYWEKSDNSIYSRIFPITICNKNFEYIRDEVIKNILYSTGNIKILLEGLTLSKIVYSLLNNTKNYEEILNDIKHEIINISIKDILEVYTKNYRLSINSYPGNYILSFERKRIDLINLLNDINTDEFRLISDVLTILREDKSEFENIKPNFITYSIIGIKKNDIDNVEIKDKEFLISLCDYMVKLRKGRISPELLVLNNYITPDVFKYNEGEEFNHSLLNKSRIIKKVENNNFVKSFIQTKSGMYRFIKTK